MEGKISTIMSNINQCLKESRIRLGLSTEGRLNIIAYKKSNIKIDAVLETASSMDDLTSFLNGLIWVNNGDMNQVAKDIDDALDFSILLDS